MMENFRETENKDNDISNGIKKNLDLWNKLIKARILLNNSLVLVNHYDFSKLNKGELHNQLLETCNVFKILTKKLILCQKLIDISKHQNLHGNRENLRSLKGITGASNILKILFENSTIRDDILTYWDENLKLSENLNLHNSLTNQIHKILEDPENQLIQRTRILRVIPNMEKGQNAAVNQVTNIISLYNKADKEEDSTVTIFDDHDFYYELVKDFIDSSKKNCQLQNENEETNKKKSSASKREIDTKCTKKRKVRYDVIPKLTNFMCPDTLGDEEESYKELYGSLFK